MKTVFENWKRYLNEGELADLKWASNPANPLHQDATPSFQQTQDRAEQLDQVDHAAGVAAEEDAAAGVRQTEAPHSWSLVADEWLEAYNHAYDAEPA